MELTMKEFRDILKNKEFLEAIAFMSDMEADDLWSEDSLKEIAKQAIDNDELLLAMHLCEGICQKGMSCESHYAWDYSSGTTCAVCGINTVEDIYHFYVDRCSDFNADNVPDWNNEII